MVSRRYDGFMMGAACSTGHIGRRLAVFLYFYLGRYRYAIRLCRSEMLRVDGSQDG
jgi:hypothetical protein